MLPHKYIRAACRDIHGSCVFCTHLVLNHAGCRRHDVVRRSCCDQYEINIINCFPAASNAFSAAFTQRSDVVSDAEAMCLVAILSASGSIHPMYLPSFPSRHLTGFSLARSGRFQEYWQIVAQPYIKSPYLLLTFPLRFLPLCFHSAVPASQ